jgi:hypothetical protein
MGETRSQRTLLSLFALGGLLRGRVGSRASWQRHLSRLSATRTGGSLRSKHARTATTKKKEKHALHPPAGSMLAPKERLQEILDYKIFK